MGNLTRIIEQYETKGVEALLQDKRLWSDLEALKQELEGMEEKEKKDLKERFDRLLDDLELNAQKLRKDMQSSINKREEIQKNSEACLSYAKASSAAGKDEGKG